LGSVISKHSVEIGYLDQGKRRPGQRLVDTVLGQLRTFHALWTFSISNERKPLEPNRSFVNTLSYASRPRYLALQILLI
ncbi:MAG: hypothetical protein ABL958_08855, partial [Bdellovibrionia bacterium]